MDYRLNAIYEQMIGNNKPNQSYSKFSSLSKLYENIANSSIQPTVSAVSPPTSNNPSKPTKPTKPAPLDVTYPEVIAYALYGDKSAINKIAPPVGNYEIGKFNHVDEKDMLTFKRLFAINPPKKGADVGTAASKGSGNGEIALFWLLRKTYPDIEDNRDAGQPDLFIPSLSTGVEVKDYSGSKRITIGRFGDQFENRKLLSVVFGLKALVDNFTIGDKTDNISKTPSLDHFNAGDLISSFETLSIFDSAIPLRNLPFQIITNMYKQIDEVKKALSLGDEPASFSKNRAREGAGKMMFKFLRTKISEKPGFGGYLVNINETGKTTWQHIPEENIIGQLSDSDMKRFYQEVLDNTVANGAQLQANLGKIFKVLDQLTSQK